MCVHIYIYVYVCVWMVSLYLCGQRVELSTLTELSLPGAKFDDIGQLHQLKMLRDLDLRNNNFRFVRHVQGFVIAFPAPLASVGVIFCLVLCCVALRA